MLFQSIRVVTLVGAVSDAWILILEDLGIAAGETTDLLPRPAPDTFYIYFSIFFSIRSFFFFSTNSFNIQCACCCWVCCYL